MNWISALPSGAKLVLGAGSLLLADLFLTWQTLELDFGGNVQITKALDGWDFWGLLIGLLTIAILAVVAIEHTDSELQLGGRWDIVPLTLGSLVLLFAVVKNVRDSDSTWASYAGIALAALVVVGATLELLRMRPVGTAAAPARRASSAGSPEASYDTPEPGSEETGPKW